MVHTVYSSDFCSFCLGCYLLDVSNLARNVTDNSFFISCGLFEVWSLTRMFYRVFYAGKNIPRLISIWSEAWLNVSNLVVWVTRTCLQYHCKISYLWYGYIVCGIIWWISNVNWSCSVNDPTFCDDVLKEIWQNHFILTGMIICKRE